MTAPTTMAALNAADREAFGRLLAGIYEDSPWVAERAWSSRPFADRSALERALQRAVSSASHAEQLDLVRKHPRLGASGFMAERSRAEQGAAGLRALPDEDRERLLQLNDAYERRFGFPFIVAVKGLALREIIANCRARLENDPAAEHAESLCQVHRIAAFRLADAVGAASSRDPTALPDRG